MDTQDTKLKEKKENVLKKNSAMQEWKSCNRESVYIKLGDGGRCKIKFKTFHENFRQKNE